MTARYDTDLVIEQHEREMRAPYEFDEASLKYWEEVFVRPAAGQIRLYIPPRLKQWPDRIQLTPKATQPR